MHQVSVLEDRVPGAEQRPRALRSRTPLFESSRGSCRPKNLVAQTAQARLARFVL